MSLREQITADMKEAMRARDTIRLEAVRLLRAAIQRREVDEQIELTDDEVLSVIQKMIKGEPCDFDSSKLSKREWNELMESFGFKEKIL